jgi:calmodulin
LFCFFFEEKFELTFEDFKQIIDESWTSVNNDRNILRKAFENFDHSKEGYIDIEQFRIAMRTLGEPLSDDEIDGLIQLGLNDEHRKIDIECKFLLKLID